MEIPFYYSFKEFLDNYETDYIEWQKLFSDGSKDDYNRELLAVYTKFVNEDGTDVYEEISSFWIPDEYPEYHQIGIEQYWDIMQSKLNAYFALSEERETPENFEVLDYWEICNFRNKLSQEVIDDSRHRYYKYFFNSIGFDIFFNDVKYRNFKFSVLKIYHWLNDKLSGEGMEQKPEPEKPKLRTSNVNYKFALMEEMGVLQWLKSNIHTNNTNRAEILMEVMGSTVSTLEDYITGKSVVSKDVRQKALDFINDRRYPK